MRASQPVSDGYAEQTRARYPDSSGSIKRDGVRLYYEFHGSGEPTIFLLPTWSIVHSRHWKMQIPYLARHCRVVTYDGRGNGRSDRPAAGYDEREFAADALAVMEATGTGRAVIVSLSLGAQRALLLAADQPDRVAGAVFIAPSLPLATTPMDGPSDHWDEELSTDEGWAKYNRHYWLRDYRGFLEFFFSQMFTEPHSTKPREDCVGWGLDTTAETLIAAEFADVLDEQTTRGLCRRIRCPVLVIQGTADAITGKDCGIALAEATGGQLALLEGAGHGPHVRDPVKVNLLLRDFAAPPAPPRRWVHSRARRKRALYISSPIRPYVHELYRHLAVCDLAVVQGGLTTTMELTAARRPFIYFPLRHHFEQNFHVRHRLQRYRAGRYMDYVTASPTDIADAIASEIGREADCRPVATDGAARAAALLADLL